MTTITITATNTTETIPADRLAIGVPAFERLYGQRYTGQAVPAELHIVESDPDFATLDALDDDLRDRAVTVGQLAASGRGYVLLPGEGVDGCDCWALATIG